MNRNAVTSPPGPFFLAVAAFQSESSRSAIDPEHLRSTLTGLLAECERLTRAAGVDAQIFEDVKYALVALADELAIHSDWDHREMWRQRLLELEYFNTSFAGAEFFDRLTRIWKRVGVTQDPNLREVLVGVLEVYYTCLRLGFQGRFRNARGSELQTTTQSLLTFLWPGGDDGLHNRVWPDAYAQDGGHGHVQRRGRFWWWPVPLSLLLAVGLWFGFSMLQAGRVGDLVERVGELKEPDDLEDDEEYEDDLDEEDLDEAGDEGDSDDATDGEDK